MTNHYYINATNSDGESFDLIVEANSKKQALQLWRNWLRNDLEISRWDRDDEPPLVFAIPADTGKSRYYGWHQPGGVEEAL